MTCVWHLCNNKLSGRQSRFCSVNCKNKYHVDLKRKRIKLQAIEYKGGFCQICGYKKCTRALHFHHLNPDEKDFNIAYKAHTRSWKRVKEEIDKCVLVCANCHAEIHDGIVDMSILSETQ